MAEPERRSRSGGAIWGSFLLVLGAILILQTTGVLPWTLWGTLWRFWPAVLIAAGITLMMRRRSFWLVTLLSLAVFGGSLGIAIWQHGPLVIPEATMVLTAVPQGDETRAEVVIDFDAVAVDIGSLAASSADLAAIESDEVNGRPRLRLDIDRSAGLAELRLSTVDLDVWGFD